MPFIPITSKKRIGSKLYVAVTDIINEKGIKVVEVSLGSDHSHAPARRAYEKSGFTPLPIVNFYKKR